MSLSLILIGVISLIVIGGTGYLFFTRNQDLTQQKKGKILLIVGSVIFVSFLVTTLKHRNLQFSSQQIDEGAIDISKIFFGDGCRFQVPKKYNNEFDISSVQIEEIYKKNYLSLYELDSKTQDIQQIVKDYQQILLYLSKKDEGASYFLNQLARKRCEAKRVPVIYLKLDRQIKKQKDFLQTIGINTFEQLQKYICHYSGVQRKITRYGIQYISKQSGDVRPYIIIDNFQHLLNGISDQNIYKTLMQSTSEDDDHSNQIIPNRNSFNPHSRLLNLIIQDLVNNCKANIILNTQKEWAVQQLYQLWQQNQTFRNKKLNIDKKQTFPFQFHRWSGLKQYDIYKIISTSIANSDSYISKVLQSNKQEEYTFKQFWLIVQQIKSRISNSYTQKGLKNFRDQLNLKQWNIRYSVAKYFGLQQAYRLLKISQNKRISKLRHKVQFESLVQLEQIGLIQIKNGQVLLK